LQHFGSDVMGGDLIARARAIVGEKAVIGVDPDPHCHLTEQRVRSADLIICFKEYPHVDFAERAEELVTLVVKAIRGDIRPEMSLYDCRMIDVFPTTRAPGIGFVAKMKSLEGRGGVLSVSLARGADHCVTRVPGAVQPCCEADPGPPRAPSLVRSRIAC
jgi:microcystin degradation protein MlrC